MRTDILEREADIRRWVDEQRSKAYMYRQLNCKAETLDRYLDKLGITYKGNQNPKGRPAPNRLSALEYLSSGAEIRSSKLRKKLIEDGIKEAKCEHCEATEWLGGPIPLELHHKDNNHHNNELANLLILCPNCHSIAHQST